MSRRPPFLARLLGRAILPRSVRDDFMGDLDERFAREALDDPAAARRAYWHDVLSPTVLRLRREVKGMPLPPGARPRNATGDGFMSSLMTDLKFAFRQMRKAPVFTAVAVLSLALGIGPNTAIFSLVDAALLQDWGVPEPERIVDMYELTSGGEYYYTYYSVYERIVEGTPNQFEAVAASAQTTLNAQVTESADGEFILGEMVTGNYFDVLGVSAGRGRTFLPEEDATPGTHPVVVISHRFWQRSFGGASDVVGSEFRLNGRPYTVIGIAPEEFKGRIAPGIGSDFWVPIRMYPHLAPTQMTNGNLFFVGRLAPGVSTAQATAALDAVAARYNESRPESRSTFAIGAVNLADVTLHPGMDRIVGAMAALLFGAVGLVLLVACVNLAGFLLARSTERRKEMAIRIAMGATRRDIIRQLTVESVVLATLGGVVGLALGLAASRLFLGVRLPIDIPLHLEVGLNGRLLLFTGASVLIAAVIFGLTPALEALRAPTAATLRDESGAAGGRRKGTMRGVLVAGQMALSTFLLFGAGLFLRSLQEATSVDVGFDTGPAAVVTVEAWASEMTDEERSAFAFELLRQTQALPGVRAVATTSRMPLDIGVTNTGFDIPGVDPPPDQNRHVIEFAAVSSSYFDFMGIQVVEGVGLDGLDSDTTNTSAVLTRAAAERWWPGESAIGRVMYRGGNTDRPVTVIGVVDDTKIWSLTEAPRPYLYFPMSANAFGRYHVLAKGTLPPQRTADAIRDAARTLRSDVFVSDTGTMSSHLSYIYFLPRMAALILSAVGVLALILACVGLYGLVSYAVAQRTREMGVRMALGADSGEVVGMVVKSGLAVVVIGGILGVIASVGLGSLLERFLIGVDGLDPLTLLAAPLLLTGIAALAAYLPARRASRVNPVDALRSE